MAFCSNCGGELNDSQDICLNCGVYVNRVESTKEGKSRIAAGVLGILLGGLGVHKFYMGRAGMGILYIMFCWTFIPSIVGFVEGIIYLCENDASFQARL